jgi:hypothetical protein
MVDLVVQEVKENKKMLVNINEDILKLLELEETEDNKEMIENVVNSYLVGGIYTGISQGASSVNKEEIENLMYYYARKMLLHTIKKMLNDK